MKGGQEIFLYILLRIINLSLRTKLDQQTCLFLWLLLLLYILSRGEPTPIYTFDL